MKIKIRVLTIRGLVADWKAGRISRQQIRKLLTDAEYEIFKDYISIIREIDSQQ